MESLRDPPDTHLNDEEIAAEELLPVVYEELRKLAASRLKNESGSQTLQPTALVHEAWLRIAGDTPTCWRSQAHFFGAAAQAMRRILVERARAKAAAKRTPPPDPEGLEYHWIENDDHIIMIHECLKILEQTDATSARVVLLKFYGGLSSQEISRIIGQSIRSVERQWMFAKAKLYRLIVAYDPSRECHESE